MATKLHVQNKPRYLTNLFTIGAAAAISLGTANCGSDDDAPDDNHDGEADARGGGGSGGSTPNGGGGSNRPDATVPDARAPDADASGGSGGALPDVSEPPDEGTPDVDAGLPDADGGGHDGEAGPLDATADAAADVHEAGVDAEAGPVCEAGVATCNGACVSLATSGENCGACGHSCLGGACVSGVCGKVPFAGAFTVPQGLTFIDDNLYVADYGDGSATGGSISKIAPDGTVTLFKGSLGSPSGLASDGVDLYYTTFEQSKIYKINLASGEESAVVKTGLNYPIGVAVNSTSLFVTFDSPPPSIPGTRMPAIFTYPKADVSTHSQFSTGAGPSYLDVDNQYVYWTEDHGNRIARRPLQGSGAVETIAEITLARGIALDGGTIYFTTFGDGVNVAATVGKVSNTPGATPTILVQQAADEYEDIAVDSKAIYWGSRTLQKVLRLAK